MLLERADKDVEDRERELGNAEAKRNAHNRAIRDLQVSDLPVENLSGRTTLESLVLSIDGAALELPYFFFDFEDPIAGVHEVLVEANVKDSQIAAGGGTVKVTFPFYPQDRWSATYQMHDGSQSFEVMRVSESS
ncbi:MAG: hypothetical protein ABSG51_15025, partial [Terracidiphilus sp.]